MVVGGALRTRLSYINHCVHMMNCLAMLRIRLLLRLWLLLFIWDVQLLAFRSGACETSNSPPKAGIGPSKSRHEEHKNYKIPPHFKT